MGSPSARQIPRGVAKTYRWLWRHGLAPGKTGFADPLTRGRNLVRFFSDWRVYQQLPGAEPLRVADSYPQLGERTASTSTESHYFYQAIWAGRLIAEQRPTQHIDVGSDHRMVGMLTWLTRVAFVDIRPLRVRVEGLEEVEGSILALPFRDESIGSLSCLHVAEHVGLGRYGDALNPAGTREAARELSRVLARGGRLYFSVPVGRSRVEFNAHRVHTPAQVIDMFSGLELQSFSAEDDSGAFVDRADPAAFRDATYACGMFAFRKSA